MLRIWQPNGGHTLAINTSRGNPPLTPPLGSGVETRRGVRESHKLVIEAERLIHNLHVHLDEVQELINARRGWL